MNPLGITVCVCLAICLIGEADDRPLRAAPDQLSARKKLPIVFARDVYPILQRSCLECHGEHKQEGDLRLDLRDDALQSDTIEFYSPNDSELLRRILLPRGHDEAMPAIGDPLTKQQISVITFESETSETEPSISMIVGHARWKTASERAVP